MYPLGSLQQTSLAKSIEAGHFTVIARFTIVPTIQSRVTG
jgi:hypothetical protein